MAQPLDRMLARPGETLAQHTLAVVEQVRQLAGLRPLPQYPRLWSQLEQAAYLHDSGKLAHGFQRSLKSRKHVWGQRHEILSLAFVPWLTLPDADRRAIIAAVATHHRDASWLLDTYRPSTERAEALIAELTAADVRAWYNWLVAQGLILNPFVMPTAHAIYAALSELDDWLLALQGAGSDHPDFAEAVLLRGYMLQADHRAAAGTPPLIGVTLKYEAIDTILDDQPYPHQERARQMRGQSALLLAPTGSGKTEAALLWTRAGARLFYLLPYRASMDAMKTRLEGYTPHVGLQHGRALATLYYQLLDTYSRADALAQARAALNLSRLMRQPVRVFSPYHLLRAAYQIKGFEALVADCQDADLIVDEIHAYAPERLAAILTLLALLRDHFGLRLLIMTATLPPVVADAIRSVLGELPVISADSSTYQQFTRHRVFTRPGDLTDALPDIAERASDTATLVTVNTVRRARAAADRLRELGCTVLLLHGRFNARDRRRHEHNLLTHFGRERQPPPYPVVVATQVVEVSLDISLDVLYSDPAPLDALLQRFGRINRRRQQSPRPVYIFAEPTGAADRLPIYDPALVARSYAVLAQHDGETVNEAAVTAWLAEAYADPTDWQLRFDSARADFQQVVIGPLHPFESADAGLTALFRAQIDECAVLPITLEDEYEQLKNDHPVEAAALTVSLRWGQYKMLEGRGQAWPSAEPGLFFTSAAYDPDTGLQLEDDQDA